MGKRKHKTDPNSILYRVRQLVATLDGEFSAVDVAEALKATVLKKSAVSSALSVLKKEGVIEVARREPKAPRRVYFKRVRQEEEDDQVPDAGTDA